jgi:hypothetical protein
MEEPLNAFPQCHPLSAAGAGRIARARGGGCTGPNPIATESLALFEHAVINYHAEEEGELFPAVLRSAQPGGA